MRLGNGKIKNSLLILSLLIMATTETGCFRMGSLFGFNGSNGNNSTSAVPSGASGVTAAVKEASQIMPTFAAVTGVTPSSTTMSSYKANIGNFSVAGLASDVNPPMMFAYATVAGNMCNDLVNSEKAKAATSRRFFGCIDFTQGPSQFSGTCLNNTADIMARSFYGADLSSGELSAVTTGVQAMISGAGSQSSTTQTQSVAIGLCTAMLASMNSISH